MSIQSEITRIITARNDSFDSVSAKGGTVPTGSTIDDLPSLILSIPTGGIDITDATAKQDEICLNKTAYIATGKVTGTGDIVHTVFAKPSTKDTSIIKIANTTDYYAWKEGGTEPTRGIRVPIENKTINIDFNYDNVQFIQPIEFDYNIGYIADGTWKYENPTNTFSDIYLLNKNAMYFIGLGENVGTRFRSAYYTTDPRTKTSGSIGGFMVTNINNPATYSFACFLTGNASNVNNYYFVVAKDNVGKTGVPSYMVKIEVITTVS